MHSFVMQDCSNCEGVSVYITSSYCSFFILNKQRNTLPPSTPHPQANLKQSKKITQKILRNSG